MIPRWMPYSIPIYIDPIKAVFARLNDQAKAPEPKSDEFFDEDVDSLQQACDKLDQ